MSDAKDWSDRLEDVGSLSKTALTTDACCVASIAISLKRIADALDNRDPYDNPIAQAILNGISQGAQDWIGRMERSGR